MDSVISRGDSWPGNHTRHRDCFGIIAPHHDYQFSPHILDCGAI